MQEIYEFYDLIGKNLKRIRKDKNDSQEKMSEKLNMSRGFISQLEADSVKVGVSLDTLFNICKLYNIDIREFFDGFEKFLTNKK